MNSDNTPVEPAEEGKLALIVPQYTYDAKTFQLLRRKNNEEFDKIINRVSFRKDGYSITDADSDEFYAPQDAIDDEEWASRSHFVGNAKTLTELYTALYENRAFSQVCNTKYVKGRLSIRLATPSCWERRCGTRC